MRKSSALRMAKVMQRSGAGVTMIAETLIVALESTHRDVKAAIEAGDDPELIGRVLVNAMNGVILTLHAAENRAYLDRFYDVVVMSQKVLQAVAQIAQRRTATARMYQAPNADVYATLNLLRALRRDGLQEQAAGTRYLED